MTKLCCRITRFCSLCKQKIPVLLQVIIKMSRTTCYYTSSHDTLEKPCNVCKAIASRVVEGASGYGDWSAHFRMPHQVTYEALKASASDGCYLCRRPFTTQRSRDCHNICGRKSFCSTASAPLEKCIVGLSWSRAVGACKSACSQLESFNLQRQSCYGNVKPTASANQRLISMTIPCTLGIFLYQVRTK